MEADYLDSRFFLGTCGIDAKLIDAFLPNLNHFVAIDPRADIAEKAEASINKLGRDNLKVS